MKRLGALLLCLWGLWLPAAETLPPKPAKYFNDYANVVAPGAAAQFNQQLTDFERATSSQIVVAVFPKLDTASSLEDFTHRIFTAWQVGQKDKNNGAVLFVFVAEHKLRIEVGYGLEGALPDAISKRIIAEEITPHFRNGDYTRGLGAGINAMLAATKGEYQGTGRTNARNVQISPIWIIGGLILFVVLIVVTRGQILWWILQIALSSGRSYSSGGVSRGGSWGGSGGGGFSGGGGRSGGGGASGSW
ncbi:MAG: TPM domain-containing protein [Verrucomicrobia bacterium]|nr:TPM domain-containing protein [Verrucomicrobiota bacterium]